MRKRAILMMAYPYSQSGLEQEMKTKPGLYANINAKQARIKAGSGEKMNKVGSKAAPSAADFRQAAKTAKKPKK
jgi:hypothetical protein